MATLEQIKGCGTAIVTPFKLMTDNKGYAAVHAEQAQRAAGAADAVAIFAQATAGDVSMRIISLCIRPGSASTKRPHFSLFPSSLPQPIHSGNGFL